MEFSELIKKRRACHNFLAGMSISNSDLEKIIAETSLTPSGYNAQPWEFIIVKNQKNLAKIHDLAYQQPHLKNASAIIVILADLKIVRNVDKLLTDWLKFGYCTSAEIPAYKNSIAKNRKPEKLEKMALRNAMLAAMTLIYSAENLGYSTCPIMGFSQQEVGKNLKIPDDRTIALMVAIGYQNPQKKENPRLPRKTTKELIHWEKF